MRVAAADGGTLEQAATHAFATRAFQHRYTELRRALVAFSRQIGQVADANHVQLFVEHAEHGIAREIDIRDVILDHTIRHDLAKAQETVVFIESEEVLEETFAVARGQLTDENGRTTGSRLRTIGCCEDRCSVAVERHVHDGGSLIRRATWCVAKRILAEPRWEY